METYGNKYVVTLSTQADIITRETSMNEEKTEPKQKTLREKLMERSEQLDAHKKQLESSYLEIVGALGEVRRTIQMLDENHENV